MNKLIQYKVSNVIEYANNPRKNDHAVDKMAAAIKEFGFRIPLLIQSDGVLVDGHLRLKAAKKLGLEEVPALLCDDMSETQIKAFRISVNRMADLAEWDEERLRLEIDSLTKANFSLDSTGFDSDSPLIQDMRAETQKLSTLEFADVYYEPKKKPKLTLKGCIDFTKYNAKIDVVEKSNLPDSTKEVMKFFCQRFIKIDFESVANYYAFNASEEEQKVIERLRMVLCDSGAINGFIEDELLKIHESIDGWLDDD